MPIITFWSNNEKTIGQSVSAAVAATVMSIEHNYKILLISADFNNMTIENCFGAQESNKAIVRTLVKNPQISLDSGINGLLKLADSNRVTPELIHDYTKIIFKNRLEILYSPMLAEDNQTKIFEKFKTIILNAARYYDYVIVDLKKGLQYNCQIDILQMSDIIVENIDQGTKTIEKLYTIKSIEQLMNKLIWNICRYDNKSKYNTKNLTRSILKRQNVFETPYHTLLLESTQEGNLVELILRLKTLKEDDDNKMLIKKTEELIEGILFKQKELQMKM